MSDESCDCESCQWLRSLTDDELQMKIDWLLHELARRKGEDMAVVSIEILTPLNNTDKGKMN